MFLLPAVGQVLAAIASQRLNKASNIKEPHFSISSNGVSPNCSLKCSAIRHAKSHLNKHGHLMWERVFRWSVWGNLHFYTSVLCCESTRAGHQGEADECDYADANLCSIFHVLRINKNSRLYVSDLMWPWRMQKRKVGGGHKQACLETRNGRNELSVCGQVPINGFSQAHVFYP